MSRRRAPLLGSGYMVIAAVLFGLLLLALAATACAPGYGEPRQQVLAPAPPSLTCYPVGAGRV